MLDEHQRVIAGERKKQLGAAQRLVVGHAGDGLVEQQQLRLLHQQHADLEPLLLAMRQETRGTLRLRGQLDRIENGIDPASRGRIELRGQCRPNALVVLARELQILEHRVPLEHRRLLEFPPDAAIGDLGL